MAAATTLSHHSRAASFYLEGRTLEYCSRIQTRTQTEPLESPASSLSSDHLTIKGNGSSVSQDSLGKGLLKAAAYGVEALKSNPTPYPKHTLNLKIHMNEQSKDS